MNDSALGAQRCALASAAIGEIAAGSAASATCWVLLEQPGAWGRKAATQSDLDPELGARLDALVSSVGGRFGLIREPNKRVSQTDERRTVLIAGGLATTPWLVRGTVTDASDLEELTPEALTVEDPAAVLSLLDGLEPCGQAVALVCTNGSRDLCCAVEGRPVAIAAGQARPGLVYETSHTGGHRFAPTGVVLPSGLTFARASADDVVAGIDAASAGCLAPELNTLQSNRGMSYLSQPEQVALAAVQAEQQAPPLTGWRVVTEAEGNENWQIRVSRGGRDVLVRVTRDASEGDTRPLSCGAEAKLLGRYRVEFEEN